MSVPKPKPPALQSEDTEQGKLISKVLNEDPKPLYKEEPPEKSPEDIQEWLKYASADNEDWIASDDKAMTKWKETFQAWIKTPNTNVEYFDNYMKSKAHLEFDDILAKRDTMAADWDDFMKELDNPNPLELIYSSEMGLNEDLEAVDFWQWDDEERQAYLETVPEPTDKERTEAANKGALWYYDIISNNIYFPTNKEEWDKYEDATKRSSEIINKNQSWGGYIGEGLKQTAKGVLESFAPPEKTMEVEAETYESSSAPEEMTLEESLMDSMYGDAKTNLKEGAGMVKDAAPYVLGIGIADALRRATPGYQLKHGVQLSMKERIASGIKGDYKSKDLTDRAYQVIDEMMDASKGYKGGPKDSPVNDKVAKVKDSLDKMFDDVKSMSNEDAKKFAKKHARGTARHDWKTHLGEPLTEAIIRSTWDNPKEGIKWWRDEIIKAEKTSRAYHKRVENLRKLLGKPPLTHKMPTHFHSDVMGVDDWKIIEARVKAQGKISSKYPKQSKAVGGKIGGAAAVVLSGIALIRTAEDPDVTQSGGSVEKAIKKDGKVLGLENI